MMTVMMTMMIMIMVLIANDTFDDVDELIIIVVEDDKNDEYENYYDKNDHDKDFDYFDGRRNYSRAPLEMLSYGGKFVQAIC